MTEKEANDKKFYVAAAAIDKDGHASPLELPLICQEEKNVQSSSLSMFTSSKQTPLSSVAFRP